MASLIRKISTKTVGYTARDIKARVESGPVHLYNVAGRVNGVRRGESTTGPWVGFLGEFQANLPNGNEFTAPQCFLPEPFSGMLEAKLESEKDSKSAVEFAIEVWAKPSDTNVGYEYEVKPVVKMQESSNLAHLLEQFDAPKAIENKASTAKKK